MTGAAASDGSVPPEGRRSLGSVLIPAYNEAEMIGSTLRRLDQLCARLEEWDWEIVVVDDGSTDETSTLAAEAAAQLHTPVRILRHRRNRHLGGALRTGLLATRGDVVVTADCDLSYSEACLERLVHTYEQDHPDVVIASPYMPGGQTKDVPRALEVRSRVANRWLRLMSLDDIHTLTGMVRAYRGDFIRAMALKAVDVDINAEILYKAQLLRATIVEIPATLDWSHLRTRAGRSRLLAKRARTNTIKQVINGYLWRPFLFPLFAGAFFLVAAVPLTLMSDFSMEHLAIAFWVLGVLLMFQMLSTLQAKRYFEELYVGSHQVRSVLPTPAPLADETYPHPNAARSAPSPRRGADSEG